MSFALQNKPPLAYLATTISTFQGPPPSVVLTEQPLSQAGKVTIAGQQVLSGESSGQTTPSTRTEPVIKHGQQASSSDKAMPSTPTAIGEELNDPHLLANVFGFLSQKDAAQAAQVCRAFRRGKQIADVKRIEELASMFGVKGIAFTDDTKGSLLTPNLQVRTILNRLNTISNSLSDEFRKKHSIEHFVPTSSWLLGFFQNAYDCQLLLAFGPSAGVNKRRPLNEQICKIHTWCTTSKKLPLDLSERRLLIVPKEVRLFKKVSSLNLRRNLFSALPLEIGNLPHLWDLYLEDNQIEDLSPHILGHLTNLGVLNVKKNRLRTVPPEIGGLSNLTWLDVSYNRLDTLPEALFHLPNLQHIVADGNPNLQVPEKWLNDFRARGGQFFSGNPQ
jgi:hypothetical protein